MIHIVLPSKELSFPPRSPLEFEMEWRDLERDEEILVNVFWTVKSPSPGDGAEGAVERSETLTGIGSSGSRKISIELPAGPYSYQGKNFSIQWGIEAIAKPSMESDLKKFVLSPTIGETTEDSDSEDIFSSPISEMSLEDEG